MGFQTLVLYLRSDPTAPLLAYFVAILPPTIVITRYGRLAALIWSSRDDHTKTAAVGAAVARGGGCGTAGTAVAEGPQQDCRGRDGGNRPDTGPTLTNKHKFWTTVRSQQPGIVPKSEPF